MQTVIDARFACGAGARTTAGTLGLRLPAKSFLEPPPRQAAEIAANRCVEWSRTKTRVRGPAENQP